MSMSHKIKKIFLVLFSILTISYSQYIFAENDFIPPEGILHYENPDVHSGLIIILGKRTSGEIDSFYLNMLQNLDINFKRDMEAAQAAHSVNILYINLHNSELDLTKIGKAIRGFSEKNQQIAIISMIHGSAIFPWSSHSISIGPDASDDVHRYFAGHFVSSSELFKVISSAVGNKPIKMWQCSCQGSKTIEDAQNILPKNSIFVTEGKGWVSRPDCLFYALSHILRYDTTFNFHTLLINYAYASKVIEQIYTNYDREFAINQLFNANPIYTIIGGKSISLVAMADEFLAKCRFNQIDSKKIQQTLDKLCNSTIPLYERGSGTCATNGEQELKNAMDKGVSTVDCTTHRGERSYLMAMLMEELVNVQYKNPACTLNGVQYMFLISLGAVLIEEDFAEQLPEMDIVS